MLLHILVKSLKATATTVSKEAQFKLQHAVCNVYFPGRMGPRPSLSTLCESIQQHAVPYAISHKCAGPVPTPQQSCLPMASPTCAAVVLQAQTHNYATAKPTVMELLHSTGPDSTSSTVPSLSPHPAQLPAHSWHPDVFPQVHYPENPQGQCGCCPSKQKMTLSCMLRSTMLLPCAALSSALTLF